MVLFSNKVVVYSFINSWIELARTWFVCKNSLICLNKHCVGHLYHLHHLLVHLSLVQISSSITKSVSLSPICSFATLPYLLLHCCLNYLKAKSAFHISSHHSIHQVLDLFKPLFHLHTHSSIFFPPSMLQNPISKHPVEELQNIL